MENDRIISHIRLLLSNHPRLLDVVLAQDCRLKDPNHIFRSKEYEIATYFEKTLMRICVDFWNHSTGVTLRDLVLISKEERFYVMEVINSYMDESG